MKEINFEQIKKANESIFTMNIKGKEYALVNQRVKAFRMVYPDGFIMTEMVSNENGICVFRATVGFYADNGDCFTLGVGTAYEKESSSFINKTSYIENCETSAVGRALGMAGFGIDTSICSAEELQNAIENQNKPHESKNPEVEPYTPVFCNHCNKSILGGYGKDGKKYTAEEVKKRCGGLCADCYKKVNGNA